MLFQISSQPVLWRPRIDLSALALYVSALVRTVKDRADFRFARLPPPPLGPVIWESGSWKKVRRTHFCLFIIVKNLKLIKILITNNKKRAFRATFSRLAHFPVHLGSIMLYPALC